MSYEPRLFIKKSDLLKNQEKIVKGMSHNKTEIQRVYYELGNALSCNTIKFPEIELVVIQPEGSEHNKNVRKIIKRLKIDFREEA